jgi:excisionase family DNA binding protein
MPRRKNVRGISPPTTDEDDPMTKDLTKYVTTRQAAELLGVTQDHITRLLTGEKIRGIKLGHDWLVFAPSMGKYAETKSKRGRPPCASPKLPEKDNGQG